MQNASLILVGPFQQVWFALAAQINAWNGTMAAIGAITSLQPRLAQIQTQLEAVGPGQEDVRSAIDALVKDMQGSGEQVRKGLLAGLEPVVYANRRGIMTRFWG